MIQCFKYSQSPSGKFPDHILIYRTYDISFESYIRLVPNSVAWNIIKSDTFNKLPNTQQQDIYNCIWKGYTGNSN